MAVCETGGLTSQDNRGFALKAKSSSRVQASLPENVKPVQSVRLLGAKALPTRSQCVRKGNSDSRGDRKRQAKREQMPTVQ